MTSTQISFSTFAAPKPAFKSLAVPEVVQRGCFYPQPKYSPVISLFTGDDKPHSIDLQPGFYNFECDCLDAPVFVASGSVRGSSFGRYGYFSQQAFRYRAGYESSL